MKGRGESEIDEREEGSVRVGQGPHEAARLIVEVQIIADFEAVQRFEENAEREEKEQRPPANSKVAANGRGGVIGSGGLWRILFHVIYSWRSMEVLSRALRS